MLLASLAMTWVLNIYSPDGVSSTQYDSQEACEAARQQYEDQFNTPRDHRTHHATCVYTEANPSYLNTVE